MSAVADAIPIVERMIIKEEEHLVFLKTILSKAQHTGWFSFLFNSEREIKLIQYYIRQSEKHLSQMKLSLLEYDLYIQKVS